jgi:hypothetical protein
MLKNILSSIHTHKETKNPILDGCGKQLKHNNSSMVSVFFCVFCVVVWEEVGLALFYIKSLWGHIATIL